ncbi:hypothetical protein MKEN_00161200 [Mycena kentingensis (nom. inval.)]|nr:hypothetical protein MKEN_00161200 [Mycena kentingensis (nom. inval.)]
MEIFEDSGTKDSAWSKERGGVSVSDNARFYNVALHSSSLSKAIFGDQIVNVVHKSPDSTQRAIAKGYREIPLSDIQLSRELYPDDAKPGYVKLQPRQRKMYSTRINERTTTTALYRGEEEAKQEWEQEIAHVKGLCHPNLVQLYAISEGESVYAAIYHGELISLAELLGGASQTTLSRVEWSLTWSLQFWMSSNEIAHILKASVRDLRFSFNFSVSTGQFCFRIDPKRTWQAPTPLGSTDPQQVQALTSPVILSAPLAHIYSICITQRPGFSEGDYWGRAWKRSTWGTIASRATIVSLSDNSFGIVAGVSSSSYIHDTSPYGSINRNDWQSPGLGNRGRSRLEALPNGWRSSYFPSCCVQAGMPPFSFYMSAGFGTRTLWICQAEHFLQRLHGKRPRGTYAPVEDLDVEILVEPTPEMPTAFLFLAPPDTVFLPTTNIQRLAYWSLRADGEERLTARQAERLQLPPIQIEASIRGERYSEQNYEEVRAVHEARGFNPYTCEIANSLGYPLLDFLTPAKPRVNKGKCQRRIQGSNSDVFQFISSMRIGKTEIRVLKSFFRLNTRAKIHRTSWIWEHSSQKV